MALLLLPLGQVGWDTAGSHVYRAWGEMYRQSMAFEECGGGGKEEEEEEEEGEGEQQKGLLFLACSGKLSELDDGAWR